jgi:outer membrane protein OmpA-like peptidoglycan-associated protein
MKPAFTAILLLLLGVPALHAQPYAAGSLRLGVNGGVNVGGEEATIKYADYSVHPYGTLSFERYVRNSFALTASVFAGTLSAEITGRPLFPAYDRQVITGYKSNYLGLAAGLAVTLPAVLRLTPVLRPRIGVLMHQTRVDGENGFEERLTRAALMYGIGGGLEYPLSSAVALTFGYDLVLTNTDELDGLRSGDRNDALSVFTAGINILIRPGGAADDAMERRKEERYGTLQSEPGAAARRRRASGVEAGEGGRLIDSTQRAERDAPEDSDPALDARRDLAHGEAERENGQGRFSPETGRGETDRELRSLTLPPDAGTPREDLLPVREGGSLRLLTRLSVEAIERLSDLREHPARLTLRAMQTGEDRMQLKCHVEMLRDGMTFYQGSVDLELVGSDAEFAADEILDLRELIDRNDGYALLPRGNYVVRVSTVAWDHDLSSLSKAKFLNVDLRPIFGAREEEARETIAAKAVDVAAEGSNELLVNFFQTAASASDRMQREKKDTERMRASLRIAPVTMTGSAREHYLADGVEQSLNEALKLQNLAGSVGRAQHLKVVLAEVFFPIDSDLLNEEARIILDNAARLLNQHPELFAEIRGYASDVGDESYNTMLATRRAQRVLEYLVRQKMDAYRLVPDSNGRSQPASMAGEDARIGRKVEIVLRNRGM